MKSLSEQQLPDDINALKSMLLEINSDNLKVHADNLKKQKHIAFLEEQLRLRTYQRFAKRSEKDNDAQAQLFNEVESAIAADVVAPPEEDQNTSGTDTITYERKKRGGRKALSPDLPRVRIEHDVDDADKVCACGCELTVIGEDTSEQLDIVPATIQVLQHVRKKYACKACEDTIKTAPLAPQPIPKSLASPGLLAYIATSKYQDALPLHRQEVMFKRIGVDLPRNTQASWMMRCGELLDPVLSELEQAMRANRIIQCDETPVLVLKEPDKPPTSKSYMWVRVAGDPHRPIVLYDYASSRAGSVATHLFEGFSGYLQTDDYAGYNGVGAQQGVIQLGCMAHARRKFMEAKKATATKSKAPARATKADMALSYIAKLYAVEKAAKALTTKERLQLRQEKSVPILNKLREWLDKTLHETLPKGLLGKALSYLHKNWDKLTVYVTDGELNIDNNRAENAIRPFVIGRKNWLFSDTPRGAKASAAMYSIIETAKANGLEPYAYLRHLFAKLPAVNSPEQLQNLMPWNVQLA